MTSSNRDHRQLVRAVCDAMVARAEGDLLAAPPDDLPEELQHLVQVWHETLEAITFDSDRIHDMMLPLVVVDRERDSIKSLNRPALRLFQYDNAGELVYEKIRRIVLAANDLRELQRHSVPTEVLGRRKDGSLFHLEAEAIGPPDQEDRIIALRDITARKAMEVTMEEARDAALGTVKLQSHFLANMSHEIRTPVNGILGMAGLLLDTELNTEQREQAEAIRASGDTLLALINDILDLSKIEAGKMTLDPQPSDLRAVVQEVLTLMSIRADAQGNQLFNDYPAEMPSYFMVDAVRFRQVLTNLVGNAAKFTRNGTIAVRARVLETGAEHTWMCFQVCDSGIGIPHHKLSTIFEKFTQAESSTTRRFGGTGLGLTICRQVATLMGGNLTAESELGKGSTFSFRVPLRLAQREPARTGPPEGDGAPVRNLAGLRVLVAEDNPINQVITRRTLEKLGCIVTLVENGADADEAAASQPLDLLLMDCMMPGTDGYEGTRRIRRRERQTGTRLPIVALTAKAMKGDRDECIRAGMDDYMTKPFTTSALRKLIERWCFSEGSA